jgi:hypothetical protein
MRMGKKRGEPEQVGIVLVTVRGARAYPYSSGGVHGAVPAVDVVGERGRLHRLRVGGVVMHVDAHCARVCPIFMMKTVGSMSAVPTAITAVTSTVTAAVTPATTPTSVATSANSVLVMEGRLCCCSMHKGVEGCPVQLGLQKEDGSSGEGVARETQVLGCHAILVAHVLNHSNVRADTARGLHAFTVAVFDGNDDCGDGGGGLAHELNLAEIEERAVQRSARVCQPLHEKWPSR